jgi:hypothetical protein
LSQEENNQAARAKDAVVIVFFNPDDLFLSSFGLFVVSADILWDDISKKVMK